MAPALRESPTGHLTDPGHEAHRPRESQGGPPAGTSAPEAGLEDQPGREEPRPRAEKARRDGGLSYPIVITLNQDNAGREAKRKSYRQGLHGTGPSAYPEAGRIERQVELRHGAVCPSAAAEAEVANRTHLHVYQVSTLLFQ